LIRTARKKYSLAKNLDFGSCFKHVSGWGVRRVLHVHILQHVFDSFAGAGLDSALINGTGGYEIGPHNEGCRGGRWTADTTRRTDANGLSVRVSSHRLVSEMQHDRHERIGYALIGMPSRIRFDANVSGHRNATPQVSFLRSEMSAGNQLSDHTFGCWTHES